MMPFSSTRPFRALLPLLLIAFAAIFLVGCGDDQPVITDTTVDLEGAVSDEDLEQFQQEAEDRLAALDDEIASLRERISTEDVDAALEERLAGLEDERALVEERLSELAAAGEDERTAVRGEIESALDELGRELQDLGDELGTQ